MKVINLFGGPGSGKSTSAALIFAHLKQQEKRVELVTEFAKQLTYDKRFNALKRQAYVFAKQLYKLESLYGEVDLVVTDSPIILSSVYAPKDYPKSFHQYAKDIFDSFDNTNILLLRPKLYQQYGRNESLKKAKKIDYKIKRLLQDNNYNYHTFRANNDISKNVLLALKTEKRQYKLHKATELEMLKQINIGNIVKTTKTGIRLPGTVLSTLLINKADWLNCFDSDDEIEKYLETYAGET